MQDEPECKCQARVCEGQSPREEAWELTQHPSPASGMRRGGGSKAAAWRGRRNAARGREAEKCSWKLVA